MTLRAGQLHESKPQDELPALINSVCLTAFSFQPYSGNESGRSEAGLPS